MGRTQTKSPLRGISRAGSAVRATRPGAVAWEHVFDRVRHLAGGVADASPVSISASQDQAGGFTVDVTNLGPWKEPEAGQKGRGLAMMNELMSEIAIQTKTRVRMVSG